MYWRTGYIITLNVYKIVHKATRPKYFIYLRVYTFYFEIITVLFRKDQKLQLYRLISRDIEEKRMPLPCLEGPAWKEFRVLCAILRKVLSQTYLRFLH